MASQTSAVADAAAVIVSYVVDGLVVYDHTLEERIAVTLEELQRMTTREWFNRPQPSITVHTLTDGDDAMRILLRMGLSPLAASDFMAANSFSDHQRAGD